MAKFSEGEDNIKPSSVFQQGTGWTDHSFTPKQRLLQFKKRRMITW
jgi:hypothetical protein